MRIERIFMGLTMALLIAQLFVWFTDSYKWLQFWLWNVGLALYCLPFLVFIAFKAFSRRD